MKAVPSLSRWHVLLPVAIGTCLSLFGDASLYAVLPTHTAAAGVPVASVGILLSANRFIRLVLNGPAGMAYDRWRRRPLFVSALFIGAFSTAIYGMTQGFVPLFLGRLLWGLAWAGIWVGGNTIILDATSDDTRGRWVGLYQLSFFLGASGGALLGGLLTDGIGYHQAMIISAVLTLMGATFALLFLPETRGLKQERDKPQAGSPLCRDAPPAPRRPKRAEFASTTALYSANRLVVAGVLSSTLGLFLLEQVGEQVEIAHYTLGVATLTGLGLGLSKLVSMASAPLMGGLSDRTGNRWRVVAGGLVPGVAGFGLLAGGLPFLTLVGVPLTAVADGSNLSLATSLIGDMSSSDSGRQSQRLGVLFTAGDLASAVGPPLAYALIPWIGIRSVYLLSSGVLALMFFAALWQSARRPPREK